MNVKTMGQLLQGARGPSQNRKITKKKSPASQSQSQPQKEIKFRKKNKRFEDQMQSEFTLFLRFSPKIKLFYKNEFL